MYWLLSWPPATGRLRTARSSQHSYLEEVLPRRISEKLHKISTTRRFMPRHPNVITGRRRRAGLVDEGVKAGHALKAWTGALARGLGASKTS